MHTFRGVNLRAYFTLRFYLDLFIVVLVAYFKREIHLRYLFMPWLPQAWQERQQEQERGQRQHLREQQVRA